MRRPPRTPSHAPILIAAIAMFGALVSCSKPAPTAPTPTPTTPQTTAGSCTYGVESSSAAASVAAGGADLTVTVTTTAGCAWTSASTAPFVTATPASGTGSGQVHLAVTENLGDARTTTATIAGVTVPIAQASSCSFAVTPTTLTFEAAGGDATIAVSTRTGCSWKSATTDAYLHLGDTPPAGSGSVSLHVDANAGLGRTGTVTVAGQPVAVRQGGPPVTPPPPVTPVPPAPPSGTSFLTFTSDPDDIVGQGKSGTFTLANSDWAELVGDQYNPFVWVMVSPRPVSSTLPWMVGIQGPNKTWPAVGTYEQVGNLFSGPPGSAGLDFTGNARACFRVTGRLVVLESAGGPAGVDIFHATFEQHCEGAAPGVRGELLILGKPPR